MAFAASLVSNVKSYERPTKLVEDHRVSGTRVNKGTPLGKRIGPPHELH